jgi:hypothetical protein
VSVGTLPTAQIGVAHKAPITIAAPFVTADGSDSFTVSVRITSAPVGSAFRGLATASTLATGVSASGTFVADTYAPGSANPAKIGFTATSGGLITAAALSTVDYKTVGATFTSSPKTAAIISAGTGNGGITVDVTPDVAGSYTILVSTNKVYTAGATPVPVPYTAGDANATYTFTTASAVSSVTLAAKTGAPIGGSTYGQLYSVTLKDAAAGVSQLAPGETITLTSNTASTRFTKLTYGTAFATSGSAANTVTLDSSFFTGGVAYVRATEATALTDAVITATGSGLLSSTITSTATFSTVTGATYATATIADSTTQAAAIALGTGGHKAVTGSAPYASTSTTSALSHSYTVSTGELVAGKLAIDVTDTRGKITGIIGAQYSTYISVAAATGKASLAITTSAMADTNSFTVVVGTTAAKTLVVTAATAAATAAGITVGPNSVIKAAHGASSVLTATLRDQFGQALPNTVVTISTSGRNASSVDTTLATDATGTVSYTRADAGTSATTNKADVVSFASVGFTTATVTINYTDSTLGISLVELATPTTDDTAASGVSYTDIDASSTAGVTGALSASTTDITATVTDVNGSLLVGVPVTFSTTSDGAGVLSTKVTVYTGADGTATSKVYGWTVGTKTFTATAGAKSATGTVAYRQGGATMTDGAGEVRTISAVATGNSIIVTAKDRFGNLVAGVPLFATRTGNGTFGGGSNTNGQTTGTDGTAEFLFNAGSADSVVTIYAGSTTAVPTTTSGQTSYLVGMNVPSTSATQTAYTAATVGTATTAETGVGASLAPAGIGSVTVAMAAAVNSADTAADAAAEATDAANAATDAANAAAEAADAATALSAQVASLISGLKSQLTALTNLVIKIQKKVKA